MRAVNDKLVRLSDVIKTVKNQRSDGDMWGDDNLPRSPYLYILIDASKTIDKLLDIPAVDAAPIVHGHWVFNDHDYMFYCTNCKNVSVRNDYPYCHWCGAKMDALTKDINVHCKTDEVTE